VSLFHPSWQFISFSQPSPTFSKGGANAYYSFIDYQRSFPRPQEAMDRKMEALRKQFVEKKLSWPARFIYLRSFKYDSQLEVWVKDKASDPFVHFKTYSICALAGSLGPKRVQGDFQVPEGFYYINEFNPNSNYYLSLGLNYPNASDKILSDALKPGGEIYIHGSCVTVGCIPITDQQIDELYVLATVARDQGQHYIPVHIFPCRFDVPKSVEYLNNLTREDLALKSFSEKLEQAFIYFQRTKRLPVVMITEDGNYHINEGVNLVSSPKQEKEIKLLQRETPTVPKPSTKRIRTIARVEENVHQWPQYPGGPQAFNLFLDNTGHDLAYLLPSGVKKAYLQIEFIVDRDGVPVNFRVTKGLPGESALSEKLIEALEKMDNWAPALLNKIPVAKKMQQTITIHPR
jgi:murein L,D-transpeptidase YafK